VLKGIIQQEGKTKVGKGIMKQAKGLQLGRAQWLPIDIEFTKLTGRT
jgi:hypothetical protein